MTNTEFKDRTKRFALRVFKLVDALPQRMSVQTLAKQLLRSSSSVAANYRAACRGRSKAEFMAKLGIVEEEADESVFWLEMLIDAEVLSQSKLKPLLDEANEITAMVVASIKTARRSVENPQSAVSNPQSK